MISYFYHHFLHVILNKNITIHLPIYYHNHQHSQHRSMTTVIPFSRYNEEFSSLVTQTRQTITSIQVILNKNEDVESPPSSTSGNSFASEQEKTNFLQQKLNLSQQLLNQTKDLLKQMTIESRSPPDANSKQECKRILATAKGNHANLKDDVSAIQNEVEHYLLLSNNNSNNNSNNGNGGNSKNRRNNNNGVNSEIKQHLLDTNTSLSNQNSTIERSKQIMADTELVAMEITEELARNRETIQSAHSRVRGVNALSNQARRILVNMSRRETQQKMAVYGVGVVLFLSLLFLLGFF